MESGGREGEWRGAGRDGGRQGGREGWRVEGGRERCRKAWREGGMEMEGGREGEREGTDSPWIATCPRQSVRSHFGSRPARLRSDESRKNPRRKHYCVLIRENGFSSKFLISRRVPPRRGVGRHDPIERILKICLELH